MTTRLEPERALVHLRELASDIREGVVLDSDGRRLAGSVALAAPAAEILAQADASEVEIATDRGTVFAVRAPHASVAVVTSRFALASSTLYDLRVVLSQVRVGGAAS